jgi:arylsulfatase
LIKYPPQFKVGFLSNNPPIYNLPAAAREAAEKMGLGRRAP